MLDVSTPKCSSGPHAAVEGGTASARRLLLFFAAAARANGFSEIKPQETPVPGVRGGFTPREQRSSAGEGSCQAMCEQAQRGC